jgi:hypothetical protein
MTLMPETWQLSGSAPCHGKRLLLAGLGQEEIALWQSGASAAKIKH